MAPLFLVKNRYRGRSSPSGDAIGRWNSPQDDNPLSFRANAVAVAEHPERSGGSIPEGEGPGFKSSEPTRSFGLETALRMTDK